MRLTIQIIFFWMLLLPASQSFADFIIHTWEDHHQSKSILNLRLDETFLYSNSNFDSTGIASPGSGLGAYNRFQTDLILSYGLSARFSFFARLAGEYIVVTGSTRPGVGYGFGDQTAGLNLRIFESHVPRLSMNRFRLIPTSLDLQVQCDFPVYNNNLSQASLTPDLGDGSVDTTVGVFASIPFFTSKERVFNALFGAGYTYRNLGFSSAVPWTLLLSYNPVGDGLFIEAGGTGFASLRTDTTWISTLTARSSIGASGSFMIGGTNSALAQARGRVGYHFHPELDIYVSFVQNVWGQVAPAGFQITAGLQTRFGHDPKTPAILLTPDEFGQSNRGYLNYSLETKILKTNDRLSLVKIDKGSEDGIEVGQVFDVFSVRKDGTDIEAVARGEITHVQLGESALKITEYFKEVTIEEGFSAKRLIQ